MQVEVEAAALAAALSSVSGAIEGRVGIPILGCVLLEADGEVLRLRGTNLEREARAEVAAQTRRRGALAVSAAQMTALAKRWPDGAQASIEMAPGEVTLRAHVGRARAALRVLPHDDFPAAREVEKPALDVEVPAAALKAALGLVRMAQSTEETRYYLNGVLWHERAGELVLVATDGHRLVRVAVDGVEVAPFPAMIVPRHALRQIMELASGEAPLRIRADERRIELQAGGMVVSTSLVEGQYPDYARAIPGEGELRARVARGDLLAALQRVRGVLAGASTVGASARLVASAGELLVACETPDGDAASDVIASTHAAGGEHETRVNARYLAEALEAWPEDAVLEWEQEDHPRAPMVWRREGEPFALHMLMPTWK